MALTTFQMREAILAWAQRCSRIASSEVHEASTMGALHDGGCDGDVTIRELLQHGNFGPGTFNRLDGEMLVLETVCYQLRSDDSARVADLDQLTPFAG